MTDNGEKAKTERANYARWEATISAAPEGEIIAQAEDAAGNLEPLPTAYPSSTVSLSSCRRADRETWVNPAGDFRLCLAV